jgi:Hint module
MVYKPCVLACALSLVALSSAAPTAVRSAEAMPASAREVSKESKPTAVPGKTTAAPSEAMKRPGPTSVPRTTLKAPLGKPPPQKPAVGVAAGPPKPADAGTGRPAAVGDAIEDPANAGVSGGINPGAQIAINKEVAKLPIVEQAADEEAAVVPTDAPVAKDAAPIPAPMEYVPPAPTPLAADKPACFPGAATVEMRNGGVRRMSDLAVGDSVHVGSGIFSTVFMFTHQSADSLNEFVSLESATGAKLLLTSGHFLYVNGDLVAAKTVTVGDKIELGSGQTDAVSRVSVVMAAGLYNPQTLHGDVVVSNVRASTYTTAIAPAVAHRLLAPLRRVVQTGAVADPSFGALANGGGGVFSALLGAGSAS